MWKTESQAKFKDIKEAHRHAGRFDGDSEFGCHACWLLKYIKNLQKEIDVLEARIVKLIEDINPKVKSSIARLRENNADSFKECHRTALDLCLQLERHRRLMLDFGEGVKKMRYFGEASK